MRKSFILMLPRVHGNHNICINIGGMTRLFLGWNISGIHNVYHNVKKHIINAPFNIIFVKKVFYNIANSYEYNSTCYFQAIVVSDNGLTPVQADCQVGSSCTACNGVWIEISQFLLTEVHLTLPSAKWRPFFVPDSMCQCTLGHKRLRGCSSINLAVAIWVPVDGYGRAQWFICETL